MRRLIKYTAIAALSFALAFLGVDRLYGNALADAAGGQAVVDAGSVATLDAGVPMDTPVMATAPAAGSGSAAPLPSSQLADPATNPAGTISDFSAAKRYGWAALVALVLIVVCRVLGKLGGIFKRLATGKVAVVIAGVLAVAVSMFDALTMGGSLVSALLAAVVAFTAYWDSHAKPKTEPAK